MSGKGGVGKSTVSVDLALLLSQRGYHVGLMDVDLHGPSVAGMLGFMDRHVQVENEKLVPFKYSDNLNSCPPRGSWPSRTMP